MSLGHDGGGGPGARNAAAPPRGRQKESRRVRPAWRSAVSLFALAAAACGPLGSAESDTASLPVGVEGPGDGAGGSAGGTGGAIEPGGGAAGGGGPGGSGGADPAGVGGSGAGGSAGGCDASRARWASEVRSVSYGAGASFGQDAMPGVVLGPPRGAGCCAGSLDVVTLGDGGSIELGFGGGAIADGPGVDFVVFENPFWVSGDSGNVFAEPATVEVSADGIEWLTFECTATEAPWGSCAGWHPVLLDGDVDTLDPTSAGGDGFDLAEVGLAEARFVRIVDRADVGGLAGSFDLDAVGVVHPWCP